MDFLEVIEQARAVLRTKGRITYRTLKYQFTLDEEGLAALKEELIEGEQVALDENGKVLVWTGDEDAPQGPAPSHNQTPANYTPQHLAERILAEQAAMESRGSANGERKTITALFADLKGSTALIEGLDPEDARAIIDPALQLMMDAVHRYDGYVAQALGDGIFALFGAPIAHEDHPQRAQAVDYVNKTEERFYEAELYRIKGALTLRSPVQNPDSRAREAEACFQHALDIARRQGAKSWELRAATSLARLWQQQDKTADARDLLAPVYDWFTEGFDTADLKDAEALLEKLM